MNHLHITFLLNPKRVGVNHSVKSESMVRGLYAVSILKEMTVRSEDESVTICITLTKIGSFFAH